MNDNYYDCDDDNEDQTDTSRDGDDVDDENDDDDDDDDDDENDAGKPPVSLLPRKYVSNLRTSPDLESGTKLLLQLFT